MIQPIEPPDIRAYALLEQTELFQRLATTESGITAREAAARLRQFGPNALAREEKRNILLQILDRLRSPLNILLIALALVSNLVGDERASLVILGIVTLSVSLAFFQERKSNQAAESLRNMVHTKSNVIRQIESQPSRTSVKTTSSSATREIPIHLLVPGDIVHLSAGDMVPADLIVISARDLFLNQSSLTGESMPVEKHSVARRTVEPGSAVIDLENVCAMGTNVISGSAVALVVNTGSHASLGAIASSITRVHNQSNFDIGIGRFTRRMIYLMAVLVPLVFLLNGLSKGNWLEALLFAIAVAVGLTPEMLPMIVTVNLGKGALKMSEKQVIVKRLSAIQNFGAMDILCTDKTGTLTQDRIVLDRYIDLSGQENTRVLDLAYLNSQHQTGLKNLMDMAILAHTEAQDRLSREHTKKIDEVPFDFSRRRMSVIVERSNKHILICKGAVEEVFRACKQGESQDGNFTLDAGHLNELMQLTDKLNGEGLRVIAIAYKELPMDKSIYSVADESDLVLAGYVAFLDPPRESAREAIARLTSHGVNVKILTGDSELVTRKICKDVGLTLHRVITGTDLEGKSDQEIEEMTQAEVFAKLSPTQKSKIVEALRRKGHVVGFLGDGINDAPALKAADVGISVDSAVDIARESADIILLEKSLLILDEGVIEGRKVFSNILKYIRMSASSNFGNMLSVAGASAWLPFLPMAPIQVLTNNLLYDFSQTAISTDNVDDGLIARPRKWDIDSITRYMVTIGPISSLFDYATYFVLFFVFQANSASAASMFQTGWFVESLLSQTLVIHVIRTQEIPFLKSRASTPLILTSLAIVSIGIWLPYSPLAGLLGLTALPLNYWTYLAPILIAYLLLTFLTKQFIQRRFNVA